MNHPTIHTVAKEAGVSIATVSRAMNQPVLVAEETRQRVSQAIQNLHFHGWPPARRRAGCLRRRARALRVGRIAFLAPDVPHRSGETITEEMYKGAQSVFLAEGVELLLYHFPFDADAMSQLPQAFFKNHCDGWLLRPPSNRVLLAELCRHRPAVVLGNAFADLDLPCVLTDDRAGIRLVMDYLFELGHRRIAFVGGTLRSLLNLNRWQTYRFEMERRQILYDERRVKIQDLWSCSPEQMTLVCRTYLDELLRLESPPTALCAANDAFALGILHAARERGLRVPESLSITGYGDMYYAAFTDPPLTTVHMDQRATGAVGAAQLLRMIAHGGPAVQSLIQPTFVERRSCAAVKSVTSG